MWTSLCNYLYNKFFQRQKIGFRHREDSNEHIYGKRMKLVDNLCTTNASLNQKETNSISMSDDNVETSSDEDEVCIIAEIPKKTNEWKLPITKIKQEDEEDQGLWSSFTFQKNNQFSETEDVKSGRKNCGSNVNTKAQFKKFFNTQRSQFSNGKIAKSKSIYKNYLKKKLNYLQESYRLNEKLQYMQLLLTQTTFNFLRKKSPARICDVATNTTQVIDLTEDKSENEEKPYYTTGDQSEDEEIQIIKEIPGVRSLQDVLKVKPLHNEVLDKIFSKYSKNSSKDHNFKKLPENVLNTSEDEDDDDDDDNDDQDKKENVFKGCSDILEEKLRNFMLSSPPEVTVVEKLEDLPELTPEQEKKIRSALISKPSEDVLVEGFGLKITRRDMQTLVGLNWLNDEIINFYLNLIMARSKSNRRLPKVYAFNTFFYPKLVSGNFLSLRRWTKQVDIFSFDIILVPVHLGMHWCLALIDFRKKFIGYYDSMVTPNNMCLEKLLLYLKAESLDKKNKIFYTSNWRKKNVEDIPQQMNGGDCGVFSCMFAEFLSRDCKIVFTQENMPYFRKKMVIEILEKKLLT